MRERQEATPEKWPNRVKRLKKIPSLASLSWSKKRLKVKTVWQFKDLPVLFIILVGRIHMILSEQLTWIFAL